MAKTRYTPLPAPAVDASGSTYSSINAATTTTAGAAGQTPSQAPSQAPSHSHSHSHSHSQRGGRRRLRPTVCLPWCSAAFARVFPQRAKAVGYSSGFLFALGWWLFVDGLCFAATRPGGESPHVRFEDWLPGLLSTLSLVIVNLIDKDSLNADDFSYSGSNVACKARACAFIGITMAMGALGGSFAILALKYLVPGLSGEDIYFGIMITLQNIFIFVGSMTLWFGRNSGEEGYGESYSF
ncbi:hypothetical protein BDR26DRAFT_798933 [Obelidium mucronatum]|nr:hypothetical protein BDR26DRAFT_798933 [Obelidium mucronatum]